MKRINKTLTLVLILIVSVASAQLRDEVTIKTEIFKGVYSETLEQPKWIEYTSANRPTKASRKGLDFYTDKEIHTSDAADYANNIYDKGHLAPAATFADSPEHMKATFTYLNCALQNERLNRGEWRLLEEKEREWDDTQNLTVLIECVFTENSVKLPTGATVPDSFKKHINFQKSNTWKCFMFPNIPPTGVWEQYQFNCTRHKK
jgi:endonuclease G